MFTGNGGLYGFFRFDNQLPGFSLALMVTHRLLPLLLLAALAVTPVAAARDGVPILFSGRDGKPVRFDFGRRETFVPPEMQESRLERSAAEAAAFIPLVDPSVTPNSGSSPRLMNGEKPERDWIFQDPQTSGNERTQNRDGTVNRDEPKESAMLRYLRGNSSDQGQAATADGRTLPEERGERPTDGSSRGNDRSQRRTDGLRDLRSPGNQRESLLSRLENDVGLRPPEPGMTLKNFFQAERMRENEVRHREQMTEFRQLLANPFGTAPGSSGFGAAPNPLQENLPGVTISSGLPALGTGARPGMSGIGFGPSAGVPNAFDTPKVPADFTRSKTFEERKPEPIRRQMNLDIPKRDF